MKVAALMTAPVIVVRPETRIAELLELFKQNRITGVPVVDNRQRLVGIVSRQDIVLKELHMLRGKPGSNSLDQIISGGFVTVSASGLQSHSTPVTEIMTPAEKVLTCKKSTPLAEACALMADNHVHRLPVIAGNKVVGILSTLDLVRAVGQGRI